MKIWEEEPVAILGAVEAFVVLITTFGIDLTKQQAGAISLFSAAVLTVVARRKVTSPAEVARLVEAN